MSRGFSGLTNLVSRCIIHMLRHEVLFSERVTKMRQKKSMEHTELLVLSLLSREDMYGYQMIATLEKKFDSTFALKEGTLYPILRNLENAGAVTAYEQEASTGRKRRYYHLTNKGKGLLKEEAEQWNSYARAVDAVVSQAVLA